MKRDRIQSPLKYWMFYRKGCPLFALPVVDSRLRFELWRYFPAERFTWLIRYIRCFDRFGLCRWMARQTDEPLADAGIRMDAFLAEIESSTGCSPAWCVFVWPPAQRSKDRLYAYLMAADNRCVGFVKLAKTKEECVRLQREIEAAKALASENRSGCSLRIPRLLGHGHIGTNGAFVVLEPLPHDARHIHFNETGWNDFGLPCKQQFSGAVRHVTRREIEQQPWWQQYHQRSCQVPHFHADVLAALDSPVSVVRTHGDFLGHNFRRAGDEIWVFDWEEYSDCGPLLVDEIGCYLGIHRYGLGKNAQEVAGLFRKEYLITSDDRRRDTIIALAFLYGANIAMSKGIVEQWHTLSMNNR